MIFSKSLLQVLLFVLFLSVISFSQELAPKNLRLVNRCRITGVIIDSLSNKPVEFGNFVLYRLKDSILVHGTVSGKDGHFSLNVPPGLYYARVSFIGYKIRRKNRISLTPKDYLLDLDTIKLSPRSFTTGEINIIAEKERITKEDDKIILKVDKTAGNNAMDVLENSPMINMDPDGNLKLLGRKNAKIYVDGQPMNFSGYDKFEDLKMISVNEIDKIELISDPSFEFDERPEGGIINIITRKISLTKYSGTLGVSANTKNNLNSSASLGYSYKDVYLRGKYFNGYTKLNTETNSEKSISLNNSNTYLRQSGNTDNNSNSNYFGLSLNLNPGINSSLFVQTGFRRSFTDNRRTIMNYLSGSNLSYAETYRSNNNTHNQQRFFNSTALYNKKFEKPGRTLGLVLGYVNNSMNMNNELMQKNLLIDTNASLGTGYQSNTSVNTNKTLSWGLNYADVFFENIKFRTGYRGSFIRLSMDNRYTNLDQVSRIYIEDMGKRLLQRNEDTRHSAYGSVDGKLWDFRYGFGLSFEKKFQLSEQMASNEKYSYTFFNIVPSFSLSRKFLDKYDLTLGFFRQCFYPQNRQLNPHTDYTDSTNLVMGNPDLEPSYDDIFTLRCSVPVCNQEFHLGAFYTKNSNLIERITTQLNSKVSQTTYKNISSRESFGIGVSTESTFFNCLRLDPDFSLSKTKYDSPTLYNNSLSWDAGIRSNLSINDFRLMLNFQYSSPSVSMQEKSRSVYYVNAAIKALFFNKALSLTLKADDIFNTKNLNSDRYGTGFRTINNIRQTTRIISLDISYFFQTQADEELRDLSNQEEYDDDF